MVDALRKLNPRQQIKNPVMFIVAVGAIITTLASSAKSLRAALRVQFADHDLAVVHGVVRQLRRSDGRGARQGPGRQPPQDAHADAGPPPKDGREEKVTATDLKRVI